MKYDYDLIVIGGGAAGLTASTGSGQLGAKTLLVEKEPFLGGDCLHYGCVPSKTLIKSAKVYHLMRHAAGYGLPQPNLAPVDFSKITERIRDVITTIQHYDSPDYIKEHYNVETLFGEPVFINEHTLCIDGKKITGKAFIIATGSRPAVPSIEGIDTVGYLTNKEIFSLTKLPASMIVLGGGPIGLEIAQSFARLGSKVTVVEFFPCLLAREDNDISQFVRARLESEGITVLTDTKAIRTAQYDGGVRVTVEENGPVRELQAERLFVAIGRRPNTEGLALEAAGIAGDKQGITVDKHLRTSTKHIYACGDVNGRLQFTHVAGYEAGIAMVNVVMHLPASADYRHVPWCTYLDPEVASIGLNERRAQAAGLSYTVQKEAFSRNDRALAESETAGFIKLIIDHKGVARGVQIVGLHAGEAIHEWVAALNGKVSLSQLAQSIHAYPTLSEINKTSSGNYLAPKFFNDRVRTILKLLFHLQGKVSENSNKSN